MSTPTTLLSVSRCFVFYTSQFRASVFQLTFIPLSLQVLSISLFIVTDETIGTNPLSKANSEIPKSLWS